MSILEAIRRAVTTGEIAASADQPGAGASITEASDSEGNTMSDPITTGAVLSAAATVTANADVIAKAKAETRDRIKAITTSAEAKGRESLASHLAYETDMGVDAAVATLKAASGLPTPEGAATPEATVTKPDAAAYEQERLASAGLTEPGKPAGQTSPAAAKSGWAKAFARFS